MSGPHDDDFRDPDRMDREPGGDEEAIRKAKSSVFVPAVGLIGIGGLTILSAIWGLIQLPALPGKFDEIIKQIEANQKVPAQQRQAQVDIITTVRDFLVNYGPILYGVQTLLGVVILAGGIRFFSLSNPGLVVLSALGSILPFSACCFLGLIFGIWALVALGNPTVKAGFAARRRAGYFPDAPQG
jgi:hypothetical protein